MNKVILLGRLAKAPEVRQTQTGKAVASMTIAVNRMTKNEQGQYEADFINLVAWNKTAEFADKYLGKGSPILVEGRMQVRKYTAQDGSDRWITEVIVNTIEFAGPKPDGAKQQQAAPIDDFGGPSDEQIPF